MNFIGGSRASSRHIKCLTVTDDFSRECVDIAVDHGIGGRAVVCVLDQVTRFRNKVLKEMGHSRASRSSGMAPLLA